MVPRYKSDLFTRGTNFILFREINLKQNLGFGRTQALMFDINIYIKLNCEIHIYIQTEFNVSDITTEHVEQQ